MQSLVHRSRRSLYLVILGCLLILLSAGVVAIAWSWQTHAPAAVKNVEKQSPKPQKISSNVLFLGNTFWGRYINDWSMGGPLKYAYPFSRLSEFNRDQYDAWISGIECPLVAGVHMTSAEMEAQLQFNCDPNYLPEASKWFTAFTLANNHTDNQGVEGFAETKQQLQKNGIQYFGNYDPTVIEDICEVIGMPVSVVKTDKTTEKGKLPVAICAYHGVFRIPSPESVAEIAKYGKYFPVIAMPHMGAEYKSEPDQIKTDFYRSLIDGGADMVLGDHPHWIQTSESYNGHLIVYSMGNFMFDQQDTAEVIRSAGINVKMTVSDTNLALLKSWLALGDNCVAFKDDCLARATKQNLQKLKIDYKFGVVGTNDGDKIAKPATPSQQDSILSRLNWQTTTSQLRPPYSSL